LAGKIDFSKSNTPDTVSVFETTIRYLGGLLSAYELNGKVDSILVTQAQQVADKLSHAWVGVSWLILILVIVLKRSCRATASLLVILTSPRTRLRSPR
jgi:hypothetical protein